PQDTRSASDSRSAPASGAPSPRIDDTRAHPAPESAAVGELASRCRRQTGSLQFEHGGAHCSHGTIIARLRTRNRTNGRIQHLILARDKARHGGTCDDVWIDSNALSHRPILARHPHAGKGHLHPSKRFEGDYISIRSGRAFSDDHPQLVILDDLQDRLTRAGASAIDKEYRPTPDCWKSGTYRPPGLRVFTPPISFDNRSLPSRRVNGLVRKMRQYIERCIGHVTPKVEDHRSGTGQLGDQAAPRLGVECVKIDVEHTGRYLGTAVSAGFPELRERSALLPRHHDVGVTGRIGQPDSKSHELTAMS